MNSKLITNIAAGVLIILLCWWGYNYFSVKNNEGNAPAGITATTLDGSVTSIDGSAVENQSARFLALIDRVTKINFANSDILDTLAQEVDNQKLVDFSRPLPEIAQTRDNPFAPLPANVRSYVKYLPANPVILTNPATASSTASTTASSTGSH